MAGDGQKLSKRLKNYPPLKDVFENEGADSLRLMLLSSTQATQTADYMRFNRDALKDLNRNVLGTLLNTLRFFSMYADIDGWKPPKTMTEPSSTNVLDQWLLERVQATIHETTKQADNYKLAHAIQPIFELIDDTSNWYVRRSRRRFWKSEDDNDKQAAYATLHFALVVTAQLLAPWAPFVSDHIYRELTQNIDLPPSVHLTDWPAARKVNAKVLDEMDKVREYINQGLAQRANAGIKVRQPLGIVEIPPVPRAYEAILQEELNVKEVTIGSQGVRLDTRITKELKAEGMMRELVRHIQNARKQADLQVDDRIQLSIQAESEELARVVVSFAEEIQRETLATSLVSNKTFVFKTDTKIDGLTAVISLEKVKI